MADASRLVFSSCQNFQPSVHVHTRLAETASLLECLDEDGGGSVDMDEFVTFWRNFSTIKGAGVAFPLPEVIPEKVKVKEQGKTSKPKKKKK